ncbi:hypothetical protein ACFQZQ_01355 [Lysobacter koreensis]|uniref:Uncharacterized protein n=1 Tax=Lysobacter koreensis TaxID=266122 RepID=A0ABW2YHL0_9GAMM
MQYLRDFLKTAHNSASMQPDDSSWIDTADVPNKAGWYYISTNAPIELLARQELWQQEYPKRRSGHVTPVRNYDLAARSRRHCQALSTFWNTKHVYSGFAKNLRTRAREHTLPDPGTAALALGRYPELANYSWQFSYLTLEGFMPACPNPTFILRLGEQIWRAENGWPVLCAA